MASRSPLGPFIIYVKFEMREDGGLRASCDKVPGFLLSHSNHDRVRADVVPALEVILSEMYGVTMRVEPAVEFGESRADEADQYPLPAHLCKGYVGLSARH